MLNRRDQLRLLARAKKGDSAAMCALLEDFKAPALSLIRRTLAAADVGPDHAEEALARAMLKFQQVGARRCGNQAEPRTYFVRIAINCAIDIARGLAREVTTIGRALRLRLDDATNPEALLIGQESDAEHERLLAVLRRCVAELEPKYRQAIQLYYLDQAGTCEHCAELAGVSKLAFMQRLTRARRRLAEMVPRRMGAARAA